MEELIKSIVYNLVENKDAVEFTVEQEEDDKVVVTVKLDGPDVGRVIGKGGATVNAIRTVLKHCGAKGDKRYFIKIAD